jgi:hypothetical protein
MVIERLLALLFGEGNRALRETVEVFRENSEGAARREAARLDGALSQFAAEFRPRGRGAFDRFMDGLNRVPRPALALGTLGLLVAAMVDPDWFAARMTGLALVPEPLWWLLGAIVSFYFGARHQLKGQEFQTALLGSIARGRASAGPVRAAEVSPQADGETENAALDDWRATRNTSVSRLKHM